MLKRHALELLVLLGNAAVGESQEAWTIGSSVPSLTMRIAVGKPRWWYLGLDAALNSIMAVAVATNWISWC